SEEHTSELQSPDHLVCRLLLEKKNSTNILTGEAHAHSVGSTVRTGFGVLQTARTASGPVSLFVLFFFKDTATTEIYTLSLHDALPIWCRRSTDRGEGPCDRGRATPRRRA